MSLLQIKFIRVSKADECDFAVSNRAPKRMIILFKIFWIDLAFNLIIGYFEKNGFRWRVLFDTENIACQAYGKNPMRIVNFTIPNKI